MRNDFTLAVLSLLITPTLAYAQQSPWQGEWGAFADTSAYNGQRLTISACSSDSCTFALNVAKGNAHCGTASPVTFKILTATDAAANLPGETNAQSCKLDFHRANNSITITAAGGACTSYYCTSSAATFAHTYPRRSANLFTGPHSDACLSAPPPAIAATCDDPALAKLEQDWEDLYADFPLTTDPSKDENGYSYANTIDAALLTHCDTAPDPAACLHDRFTEDIALMTAKQQAYVAGYTDRGDPVTAHALALKITGRYRHSFANGDVQGEHFRSTETLTVTPVGQASIHFDAHREFYNGHTCDLSGGALFRKNGSFVYDDSSTDVGPNDPVCHLGIHPTPNGVEFNDYTGGCKMISCGERGGWNGAGFTFNERVAPKPPSK
jgi:hypothetical protein